MSGSIAVIAATIFVRCRSNSAALSAPRQSSVPDGPHGPELVLAVVSIVVK